MTDDQTPFETVPPVSEPDEVVPAAPEQPQEPELAPQEAAAVPDEAAVDPVAERPEGVPEKFWDASAGTLRTEALLKSYVELERKLGTMIAPPAGDDDVEGQARLRRLLGVPDSPEAYEINAADELITPNDEVNARLHDAGFTQRQAQLVYDLAAERLLPVIDTAFAELEAERAADRLAGHFGGPDAWRATAQQISTWGEASLPREVFDVLASSVDGVLAMHQMMQAREPAVLRTGDVAPTRPDEAQLAAMMRDPRYWRDRDQAYIAQVTDGFRQLYGG